MDEYVCSHTEEGVIFSDLLSFAWVVLPSCGLFRYCSQRPTAGRISQLLAQLGTVVAVFAPVADRINSEANRTYYTHVLLSYPSFCICLCSLQLVFPVQL